MNTELADYAAAVVVEHGRLLHESAEEPADPDAADPFTASPAHDAEQARRGLFGGDPFAARGFDVADPFSSRPGDVEADRDEPVRHETPAPGHEPAQGPEL